VIWGIKDPYLLPGNLKGLDRFVPNLVIDEISDAGHCVNHSKAAAVNARIRDFIESGR
jgi:epoxide hydrolase 4